METVNYFQQKIKITHRTNEKRPMASKARPWGTSVNFPLVVRMNGGGGGSRITTSIKTGVNDCKPILKIPLFFNNFSRKCKLGVIVVKRIRGIVRGQNRGKGSKGKTGETLLFLYPSDGAILSLSPLLTLQSVKPNPQSSHETKSPSFPVRT